MNIVMFGPPGSGKGTQSNYLSETFSLVKVDCGMLLRKVELTNEQKLSMSSGNLLDDESVISIVRTRLETICKKGQNFVLDGFPRSERQAEALFEMVSDFEISISCMVRFNLNEEEILKRISNRVVCALCGALFNLDFSRCTSCNSTQYVRRSDDLKSESIKNRMIAYGSMEKTVVNLFRSHGVKVLTIDAHRQQGEISNDLRRQLLIFI